MDPVVFRFRLISAESESFLCDLECRSDQRFIDFHHLIQKSLGFENQELASFFMCGTHWEKGQEISLLDIGDPEAGIMPMDSVLLSEMIQEKRQKLLYVFDFFNERVLFIELAEILKINPEYAYPRCEFLTGDIPPQNLADSNEPDEDILDEFKDNEAFDQEEFENPSYDPYQ